jgi:hypothetical protein
MEFKTLTTATKKISQIEHIIHNGNPQTNSVKLTKIIQILHLNTPNHKHQDHLTLTPTLNRTEETNKHQYLTKDDDLLSLEEPSHANCE